MKNFTKLILLLSLVLLIVLPLFMYRYQFNPDLKPDWFPVFKNLSTINSDWGDFGSFLSGLYSSIFSFLSLLAVLYSLHTTQKFNIKQTELLRSEQFTNEFILLLDNLTKLLSGKEYPIRAMGVSNSYEDFKINIYKNCATNVREHLFVNFDNAWLFGMSELGRHLETKHPKLFEKELSIYSAIILRITQAEDIQANAYKAILLANIDLDIRYILTSLLVSSNATELFTLAKKLDVFEMPPFYSHQIQQAILSRG
ncbi:hypothetical protein ACOZZ3_001863 [Cronobacter dublinensis]